MTEDQIIAIVDAAIGKSAGIAAWQVLGLIFASAAAAFFGSYLKEKAKDIATKEDIADITRKIETVKLELGKNKEIDSIKYNLRYEACLESLRIIDAYYSHLLQGAIVKQYASTKEARECHSKLILSCEGLELIKKFDEIMFGPKIKTEEKQPPTDLLNEYRNLIRKELGFGVALPLDRDRAWFGKVGCEKENGA